MDDTVLMRGAEFQSTLPARAATIGRMGVSGRIDECARKRNGRVHGIDRTGRRSRDGNGCRQNVHRPGSGRWN
jgi:hypothetical protein